MIATKTGFLTLEKQLDRETKAKINLIITARDGGHPARSTNVDVVVIVTDVNDNAPVILGKKDYNIVENVKEGNVLFTAKAVDADEGMNVSFFVKYLKTFQIDEDLC